MTYRTFLLISLAAVVGTQWNVDQAGAQGGGFEALGVEWLGQIPLSGFPGNQTRGNDIWAYVSPSGREYAIMGLINGTGFVEVTDPVNPMVVGYVGAPNSTWRDMKVHKQWAYIVSQEGDGLQIVDLGNIDGGVVNHVATSHLPSGLFFVAHNIAYNPDSEFAYLVLADINRGLTALDLSDPLVPKEAGRWTDTDIHDVLVVSYNCGPNAGREIAYAFCEEDGLRVIDVTDKTNMHTISAPSYPNTFYAHQGWLSEDRKYLFLGDELDEYFEIEDTTITHVFNVEDPDNAVYLHSFTNGNPAIDHNMMVRGDFLYEANYSSGLRIFDISNVNSIQEVGYFDSYPPDDRVDFVGAWGVYTALPSGSVLVSDREEGLLILDTSDTSGCLAVAGDFDGDCDSDLFDYESFLDCFTGPVGGVPPGCEVFDADNDCDIDWADFAALQLVFTG